MFRRLPSAVFHILLNGTNQFLRQNIVMSSFVFLTYCSPISLVNLFRSTFKIASFILVQSTIILLLYCFNSSMHSFLTLIFPLLLQTEDGSHHIYTAQSRALMMANKTLHLSHYYLSYLTDTTVLFALFYVARFTFLLFLEHIQNVSRLYTCCFFCLELPR